MNAGDAQTAQFIATAVNILPTLVAEIKELRVQVRWFVEHAADEKLDGYRELGQWAAQAENERDDAIAQLTIANRAVAQIAEALHSDSCPIIGGTRDIQRVADWILERRWAR